MISPLIVDDEKPTRNAHIYHLKPQADVDLIAKYEHMIQALENALQCAEVKLLFPAQPCFIRCYKGNSGYSINANDIERVNSSPSVGVNVMTKDGQEHHTNETLKQLEAQTSLVRCHMQHLVNMDCVKMVEKRTNGQGVIHTYNSKESTIPVSRRRMEKFRL